MKYFFDTSVLVKVFHEEPGSDQIGNITGDSSNEIWLLEIARLEFLSAVFRRFRNNELSEKDLHEA